MTQKEQILEALMKGDHLTPIDALNRFGSFRLADQVFKLKNEGHDVRTTLVRDGKKTYARYHIPVNAGQVSMFSEPVGRFGEN